ncbi:MAG: hypothetical protein WD716_12205 [Fimbriimonadaceae bacterium]
MNKGTKIALGILAALCLVGIIGAWSVLKNANRVLDKAKEDAVVAGNEVLALLGGSWEYEAIALRTSPEFLTKEDAQRQFDAWKSQFGPLVGGNVQVARFQVDSEDMGSPTLVADLTSRAEFEEGMADVTMTLTREPNNSWMLAEFEVRPAD